MVCYIRLGVVLVMLGKGLFRDQFLKWCVGGGGDLLHRVIIVIEIKARFCCCYKN